MNMHQVIIKISIISLVVLNNTSLFSMEQPENALPNDRVILIAAYECGNTKNKLRSVNKYCSKYITKDNVDFIKHLLFAAHKKDVESIMLSAAWYNNAEKEEALRKHYNVEDVIVLATQSKSKPSTINVSVRNIKLLRSLYHDDNINQKVSFKEFEDGLCTAVICAVKCGDLDAIKTIGAKLKQFFAQNQHCLQQNSRSILATEEDFRQSMLRTICDKERRNKWNIALIKYLIQQGKIDTLNVMLKADPFLVDTGDLDIV